MSTTASPESLPVAMAMLGRPIGCTNTGPDSRGGRLVETAPRAEGTRVGYDCVQEVMQPSEKFRRPWLRGLAIVAAGLSIAACGQQDGGLGAHKGGTTTLSVPALKLAVLDAVGGHLVYCDPDEFPIPRGSPVENARARLSAIRADRDAFEAILQFEHLSAESPFSPAEQIAINNDYKQMLAIDLNPADEDYSFTVLTPGPSSNAGILRLRGTVSRFGNVAIERRGVGRSPNCPICLATGTRIATPSGHIPVQDLRVGMSVWTSTLLGRRIPGVVLETGHMKAPLGHEVVRLKLADGRAVRVSPGHPLAGGRTVGELRAGDLYDGSVVANARLIPYDGSTWDLLPSGPTGTYFANGVLLGGTLRSNRHSMSVR
jgi:hypothetical protein